MSKQTSKKLMPIPRFCQIPILELLVIRARCLGAYAALAIALCGCGSGTTDGAGETDPKSNYTDRSGDAAENNRICSSPKSLGYLTQEVNLLGQTRLGAIFEDIDQDGNLDMLAAFEEKIEGSTDPDADYKVTIQILKNDGRGIFELEETLVFEGGGGENIFLGSLFSMAVGDMDADGERDIFASYGDAYHRFFQKESFQFLQKTDYFTLGSYDVQLADMNGDELLDVIVTTLGELAIFSQGDELDILFTNNVDNWSGTRVGDFDLDGDQDVFSAEFEEGILYLNDGKGAFEEQRLVNQGPPADTIFDTPLILQKKPVNLDQDPHLEIYNGQCAADVDVENLSYDYDDVGCDDFVDIAFQKYAALRKINPDDHWDMTLKVDFRKGPCPESLLNCEDLQKPDWYLTTVLGDGKGGYGPSDEKFVCTDEHTELLDAGDLNGDGRADWLVASRKVLGFSDNDDETSEMYKIILSPAD